MILQGTDGASVMIDTSAPPGCQRRREWWKMRTMGSPAITLRCDCGTEGRAAYAERWTCPNCGRVYDTSNIPAADYEAIAALDRRYRRANQAVVVVLALVVLAVAWTG